jgi:integrase
MEQFASLNIHCFALLGKRNPKPMLSSVYPQRHSVVVAAPAPSLQSSGKEEAARHLESIAELTDEQKQQFHQHELNSLSTNSVRTYTSDLRVFTAWMKHHYPAVVDLRMSTWPQIGLWMQSMADDGISEATIKRRLSFLRSHLVPSLKTPEVELQYQKAFKGLVKSSHTDEPKGKRALMDNDLVDILDKLHEAQKGKLSFDVKQQRMFLLFGFATLLRRSEIRMLKWKHITHVQRGCSVHVVASKTGTKTIGINARPGQPLDLIEPLKRWKVETKGSDDDYIFRGLNKEREMTSNPIGVKLMTRYVKQGCSLIGYDDVTEFGCHSMRSGGISSLARDGATSIQIMGKSKHKSLSSLQQYVKHGDFDHGL